MADGPEDEVQQSKQPMSDEDRLVLAQKMDQELDDFINSLEKKRYTEGWPEDRWEEEMDKHPFFMKNNPDNLDMSPLAEGLAKLKYDPEENTPVELATNYKEDGNFNFKHKNYRLAIIGYTEGIKQKCDDNEINASLYNNRAAAHWHLKNYRSALLDSEKALSFNADYGKARLRAANSALEIAKYDTCIQHCQLFLETQPKEKEVTKLLKTAKRKLMLQQRDLRKQQRKDAKNHEEKDEVIKAIIERGIRILNCDDEDDLDFSKIEPNLPKVPDARVHLVDGVLRWPLLFLYPEFHLTDFIKACPENVSLLSQLELLFPAPWDEANRYRCNKVNVYCEGYDLKPYVVDPKKNLGEIMKIKYYVLKAGTPAFVVVPRGSHIERRFLGSYR